MTAKRAILFGAMGLGTALLLARGAQAGAVTYLIQMDTTSLSGSDGFLDFQFNPGAGTVDPASASLTSFFSNGTLTAALPDIGDVSGALPGPVLINNTNAVNDHTEGLTYGSFIDFFVTLDIPDISGEAVGGNIFSFDLEDAEGVSVFAFPSIQIDLDALSGDPTVTNNADGAAQVDLTPEPASFEFLGTGLVAVAMARYRRNKRGVLNPSRQRCN